MANKEKLIASAQKLLAKGQLPKAVSEYQKLVGSFPKDVRSRQKLAELLSRADRTDEALAEYEQVAASYIETGFYLKAIAVYKQMQKLEPSRVEFFSKLAELNVKQGLVGNALTEYRELVTFYEQNGMATEAIPVLEKMLELDATNLNFRAKIAEILFAADRTDEALEQFQLLVGNLSEKHEFIKIVKLYDRFHDYLGDNIELRHPLADSLLASGQPEKAVQLYRKLLKITPEDPKILAALATAYVDLEDHENARLTCQHLLKVVPDDLDARVSLARCCLAAGDAEKALDSLEEFKDDFTQAGRLSDLRDLYKEIQALAPDQSRAAETLVEICALLGDKQDAESVAVQPAVSPEAEQIDSSVRVESAIDDVETLDVVGEDVVPPGGVPPLDKANLNTAIEPNHHQTLDLDLDLDSAQQTTEDFAAESVSPEPGPETAETNQDAAGPEDAEETEIELEFNLDGLDSLVLDGLDDGQEVDADAALAEKAGFADTEAADEAGGSVEEEPVEDAHDPAVDSCYEGESAALSAEPDFAGGSDGQPTPGLISESTEPDEGEELRNLDEIEELEELDEPEALDEIVDQQLAEDDLPGRSDDIEELVQLEEVDQDVVEFDDADLVDDDVAEEVEPGASDIPAELEEIAFYLHQGLYDEAERVAVAAIEQHGETPELTAKLAEIGEGRYAESEEDSMDFSDLMSELNDDELLGAADFLDSQYSPSADGDDLTQKLASELESTDTESHYNLGIAYKEMGLFDDAIAEFDKATLDPARSIDCMTLKGQSALEMGNFELAEQTLKQGLALPGLTQEGRVTLHYELGLFYRAAGRPLEALECFQVVADHDLFFRDVGEIVRALRGTLGLDEAADTDDKAKGNRDRISYV